MLALLPACAGPQLMIRQECSAYAKDTLRAEGLLEAAHQYSLQDMTRSTSISNTQYWLLRRDRPGVRYQQRIPWPAVRPCRVPGLECKRCKSHVLAGREKLSFAHRNWGKHTRHPFTCGSIPQHNTERHQGLVRRCFVRWASRDGLFYTTLGPCVCV